MFLSIKANSMLLFFTQLNRNQKKAYGGAKYMPGKISQKGDFFTGSALGKVSNQDFLPGPTFEHLDCCSLKLL